MGAVREHAGYTSVRYSGVTSPVRQVTCHEAGADVSAEALSRRDMPVARFCVSAETRAPRTREGEASARIAGHQREIVRAP